MGKLVTDSRLRSPRHLLGVSTWMWWPKTNKEWRRYGIATEFQRYPGIRIHPVLPVSSLIEPSNSGCMKPAEEQRMDLHFCKTPIFRAALPLILPAVPILLGAQPALAQTINPFPGNHDNPQHEVWTRIAIPPDHPVSNVAQWHIDYAKHQIVCDGNGGPEWLRFNHEFSNVTFHVKCRFTPVTTAEPKYNSGVFFRNNLDGSIWHQAQTSLGGGYIFGLTPVDSKPQRFNLQK